MGETGTRYATEMYNMGGTPSLYTIQSLISLNLAYTAISWGDDTEELIPLYQAYKAFNAGTTPPVDPGTGDPAGSRRVEA